MSQETRRALIVLAHPVSDSLSHSIVTRVSNRLSDQGYVVEIANLSKEGFSPAMNASDVLHYRKGGSVSPEIEREQIRVDRADALFFVFPIYWWSVPAILKGWFERVLTGGWAYRTSDAGKIVGGMAAKPVHLIATAASDESGFDRHGYTKAIRAQVVDGIFRYCGLKDTELSILFDADVVDNQKFEAFFDVVETKMDRISVVQTAMD